MKYLLALFLLTASAFGQVGITSKNLDTNSFRFDTSVSPYNATIKALQLTNFTRIDNQDNTNNVYVSGAGDAAANGTYNFWKSTVLRAFYTNANANGETVSLHPGTLPSTIVLSNISQNIRYTGSGLFDSAVWVTVNGANPAPTFSSYATNYVTNALVLCTESNQFFQIPTNTFLFVDGAGNDALAAKSNGVPWKTIQGAISNAVDGDTIFVNPGTYIDGMTLSSGVHIVGKTRETCIIGAGAIDTVHDNVVMKNRTSFENVTIIGPVRVQGTNCTIKNCTVSGVQNPDAISLQTGWGNFYCQDSWLGSDFDTVAFDAASTGTPDTNGTSVGTVFNGAANMCQFFNCYSFINGLSYTNEGALPRGIAAGFDAHVVWTGGKIEVRNGATRAACVEFNAATVTASTLVELTGVQLIYATTNGASVYAVNWPNNDNVGTCVEYGCFINRNDVHGGTLTIVGDCGGGIGIVTNVVTTNTSAGVTNFVDSEITNQIPNFIRGTTNQFAKFSPNTNTVGDSILSETTSNFVDLKAGGGAGTLPNGALAAGYRVYGTSTNSTSFKRLDMIWSVADQAFQVVAAVGSSVANGQAPILEIGSSNVTWAWTTTGTLYPMSDNNYNLGSAANARIKTIAVGTGGVIGVIGSAGAPNYTVAGAGGWYDTGDTMGFLGISSGEQFRMAKAGGVGGAYLNLGSNPLVGSPSGVTVQNSYLLSAGVNTWAFGTNLTSSTITTNRITGANSTGSNIPGGHMAISGGAPTGSGTPGALIFETATNGAAVSTQGGRQTRSYISGHPVTLTESTATTVFSVAVAASQHAGITVTATTEADDGTDFQVLTETFSIAVVNKASTMTAVVSASAPTSTATSTGTLTSTWTAVQNSGNLDVKCNAVSSLTQTTLITKYRVLLDGNGALAITAQ